MKPFCKLLLILAASASVAAAQNVAPPAPPDGTATEAPAASTEDSKDNSNLLLAQRREAPVPLPVSADTSGDTRTVSSNLAAALADGMPKFNPPTPTPVVTEEPQDLRDIDKPKNDIPRLPKYIVRESRPPVFRERDLYTPEGLIDLSFKNHPGLLIGNLFGLNSGQAKEMIYEDQTLAAIEDLNETAYAMARGGDTTEANLIQKETQDTFMRSDAGWNSGPVGSLLGGAGK